MKHTPGTVEQAARGGDVATSSLMVSFGGLFQSLLLQQFKVESKFVNGMVSVASCGKDKAEPDHPGKKAFKS